jgi:hypothetical protein
MFWGARAQVKPSGFQWPKGYVPFNAHQELMSKCELFMKGHEVGTGSLGKWALAGCRGPGVVEDWG